METGAISKFWQILPVSRFVPVEKENADIPLDSGATVRRGAREGSIQKLNEVIRVHEEKNVKAASSPSWHTFVRNLTDYGG